MNAIFWPYFISLFVINNFAYDADADDADDVDDDADDGADADVDADDWLQKETGLFFFLIWMNVTFPEP